MRAPGGRCMHRPGPGRMRPGLLLLLLVMMIAVTALPAQASSPPAPWDGTNPFNCVVQDAGFGPTGPDPGADPYCVYFDKTHQNVTQGGIADFVSKEPARTAAASPKCFYFQEDHWRSSVVQSDQQTVVYEWVGHYFYNKATGDGGVWVEDFRANGQTFDPTKIPGFPPADGRYFGPGTGGTITHDEVPVDPACVALAKKQQVYSGSTGPRCVPDAGRVQRRALGPVALGQRENSVRAELGAPRAVKRGFLRYCVAGGGILFVGERGDRSGTFGAGGSAPAVMLATTGRGFVLGRLHVGSRSRRHGRRIGGTTVLRLRRGVVALIRHHRVRELVVYDPRSIRNWGALRGYLRRAR